MLPSSLICLTRAGLSTMGTNKKTKTAENAKCIVLKKATLSWYFHVLISLMNFTTITCSGLFLSTSELDFNDMELVKHQHGYVAFLISFWITFSDLIYFNIYTVIDLIKDNKKKELLHTFASYLLFSAVFPLSLVVAILFWTFYHYDREIIYPKIMDDIFPPVLNHMTHTFPALFGMLFMVTSNKYVPPKKKSLAVLLAIMCAYTACIVHIRLRDGKWVYILLDLIRPLERACVFAFFVVGSISFHSLGYFLNDRLTHRRHWLHIEYLWRALSVQEHHLLATSVSVLTEYAYRRGQKMVYLHRKRSPEVLDMKPVTTVSTDRYFLSSEETLYRNILRNG